MSNVAGLHCGDPNAAIPSNQERALAAVNLGAVSGVKRSGSNSTADVSDSKHARPNPQQAVLHVQAPSSIQGVRLPGGGLLGAVPSRHWQCQGQGPLQGQGFEPESQHAAVTEPQVGSGASVPGCGLHEATASGPSSKHAGHGQRSIPTPSQTGISVTGRGNIGACRNGPSSTVTLPTLVLGAAFESSQSYAGHVITGAGAAWYKRCTAAPTAALAGSRAHTALAIRPVAVNTCLFSFRQLSAIEQAHHTVIMGGAIAREVWAAVGISQNEQPAQQQATADMLYTLNGHHLGKIRLSAIFTNGGQASIVQVQGLVDRIVQQHGPAALSATQVAAELQLAMSSCPACLHLQYNLGGASVASAPAVHGQGSFRMPAIGVTVPSSAQVQMQMQEQLGAATAWHAAVVQHSALPAAGVQRSNVQQQLDSLQPSTQAAAAHVPLEHALLHPADAQATAAFIRQRELLMLQSLKLYSWNQERLALEMERERLRQELLSISKHYVTPSKVPQLEGHIQALSLSVLRVLHRQAVRQLQRMLQGDTAALAAMQTAELASARANTSPPHQYTEAAHTTSSGNVNGSAVSPEGCHSGGERGTSFSTMGRVRSIAGVPSVLLATPDAAGAAAAGVPDEGVDQAWAAQGMTLLLDALDTPGSTEAAFSALMAGAAVQPRGVPALSFPNAGFTAATAAFKAGAAQGHAHVSDSWNLTGCSPTSSSPQTADALAACSTECVPGPCTQADATLPVPSGDPVPSPGRDTHVAVVHLRMEAEIAAVDQMESVHAAMMAEVEAIHAPLPRTHAQSDQGCAGIGTAAAAGEDIHMQTELEGQAVGASRLLTGAVPDAAAAVSAGAWCLADASCHAISSPPTADTLAGAGELQLAATMAAANGANSPLIPLASVGQTAHVDASHPADSAQGKAALPEPNQPIQATARPLPRSRFSARPLASSNSDRHNAQASKAVRRAGRKGISVPDRAQKASIAQKRVQLAAAVMPGEHGEGIDKADGSKAAATRTRQLLDAGASLAGGGAAPAESSAASTDMQAPCDVMGGGVMGGGVLSPADLPLLPISKGERDAHAAAALSALTAAGSMLMSAAQATIRQVRNLLAPAASVSGAGPAAGLEPVVPCVGQAAAAGEDMLQAVEAAGEAGVQNGCGAEHMLSEQRESCSGGPDVDMACSEPEPGGQNRISAVHGAPSSGGILSPAEPVVQIAAMHAIGMDAEQQAGVLAGQAIAGLYPGMRAVAEEAHADVLAQWQDVYCSLVAEAKAYTSACTRLQHAMQACTSVTHGTDPDQDSSRAHGNNKRQGAKSSSSSGPSTAAGTKRNLRSSGRGGVLGQSGSAGGLETGGGACPAVEMMDEGMMTKASALLDGLKQGVAEAMAGVHAVLGCSLPLAAH